MQTP
ncbi:hypothetical protein AZE42_10700, partial [Rhizopogon vesiculosus]|jgi:hypothetical protein